MQLIDTELKFGGQTIRFNQKATSWLGLWLDSHLSFSAYISERLETTEIAKSKITRLYRIYGLFPALVQ